MRNWTSCPWSKLGAVFYGIWLNPQAQVAPIPQAQRLAGPVSVRKPRRWLTPNWFDLHCEATAISGFSDFERLPNWAWLKGKHFPWPPSCSLGYLGNRIEHHWLKGSNKQQRGGAVPLRRLQHQRPGDRGHQRSGTLLKDRIGRGRSLDAIEPLAQAVAVAPPPEIPGQSPVKLRQATIEIVGFILTTMIYLKSLRTRAKGISWNRWSNGPQQIAVPTAAT